MSETAPTPEARLDRARQAARARRRLHRERRDHARYRARLARYDRVRAHGPWRRLALVTLGLLAALAVGCGHPHHGELDVVIEDDGCCGAFPSPGLESGTVEMHGLDPLDGYVDVFDVVHRWEGLETGEDGSIAFLSFDLYAVPYGARVRWADLVLVNEGFLSHGTLGQRIELDVTTVDYGGALNAWDVSTPGGRTETFSLSPAAAGAAVSLDVTRLVAEEVDRGRGTFQVRLDAFGGELLFEDGGANLGTGTVPLLVVGFD